MRNNFPTLIQMVNIRESNFNFPMFSISISQSSVQAMGNLSRLGLVNTGVCAYIYVCINEIIEIMQLYY